MQIADVEAVMLTGMGASYVEGDVYGLPTTKVTEFDALGTGGLYLTGLEETVVGSIGTGTVFVYAGPEGIWHIGGSAVGGGTLVGLSSRLFGIRDVEVIADNPMHFDDVKHVVAVMYDNEKCSKVEEMTMTLNYDNTYIATFKDVKKEFSNKSIYVYAVYENGFRQLVEKFTHDSK